MGSNAINMFRGDNYDAEITVVDENAAAVDITGSGITFSVKKQYNATVIFSRSNAVDGGGITEIEMSDPGNGKFKLHIVPSDTANIETVIYDYDIQVTLNTKVYTIIKDILTLSEDVTI